MVYVHGGGWRAGARGFDQNQGTPVQPAVRALLQHGYAVATVDYRLDSDTRYQEQTRDVATAVRWLQHRAEQYGIDPDRTALWGSSSGGHLASLLAARSRAGAPVDGTPQDAGPSAGSGVSGLRAVINWYGPTDLSAAAARNDPEAAIFSEELVDDLLGCAPRKCPRRAAAASPMRHLDGDEPAFLVQHGTGDEDVPFNQSRAFTARAVQRGAQAELLPYPGLQHDFAPHPPTDDLARRMTGFLDRHL